MYSLNRRLIAEAVGTFVLVFCGCGSAVLAASFGGGGIGALGVALAFGLTVLTMIYAIGAVSGGHFNPAVSIGLYSARRFPGRELVPYILAQVAGAIIASIVLYAIARGNPTFTTAAGFAANGYGEHSPAGYTWMAGFLTEVVLTAIFVITILGVTDARGAGAHFAPIAIGLALTMVHLVGIPVTNMSVNPARSTGPALFAGAWALKQLWLFWLAPLIGGMIAGTCYNAFLGARPDTRPKITLDRTKGRSRSDTRPN